MPKPTETTAPALDQVDRSLVQWMEFQPELDVSAMDVFGRVHRIYLRYRTQLAKVFNEFGINSASFGVLAALYRSGPPFRLSVSTLAHETLVSSGGMTMRLDRLEEAELITRERSSDDRRAVYAQLTAAGQDCAQRAAEAHFRNESKMLHLLDHGERERLTALLRVLEQSIDTVDDA
jgi:DNA-binding MarR family transcriptional regulator